MEEAEAADRRRSVEALAQALYEASDPTGVPWARRARIVREPWLKLAQTRLTPRTPADGTALRGPLQKGEKDWPCG